MSKYSKRFKIQFSLAIFLTAVAFILHFINFYFGVSQFLVALEIGAIIIVVINGFYYLLFGWMRSK